MAKTAVLLTSSPLADGAPAARRLTCPMGANCSCIFSKVQPAARPVVLTTTTGPTALETEVKYWADQGWQVTETKPGEVVLELQLGEGFCLNLLLSIFTAGAWLAYLLPRRRHPRIDTRRVTTAPDGTVSVTSSVARR